MKRGLFILAHGSQAKEADMILAELMEKLQKKMDKNFDELGWGSLQISKPSVDEGLEALAATGVTEIVIVPMFIFKGNHVKYDIPEVLEGIKGKYPNISFTMGKHIGADDRIVDILQSRAVEALEVKF
ncbi:sirohydrochlorin chelatase [Alkaliphilus hydrothermalis]|uniref:Sirohydrochlorin cobaltochelatase n=1 Tax=Alkaliphilus hydrothermalis TaxID=1482730 RepID=A0ABS2NP39_9FIRM|nr:CbiX/SirB N-terminal domain-containing protein [Alkaliphilus hydrothermalis]MBM7614713.1 sirohydrochlorin cobaltochelatase [Alkaliphilus hydrothermalis]